MNRFIEKFFNIRMYLRYTVIKKWFFRYRHLNFQVFLEIMNREQRSAVTFLQIGASDGVTNDPINYFVKKYGWSGTLIEPLPDIFEQLKQNYISCSNLKFMNVAVSEKNESLDIYHLPSQYVQEEWQKQLASFDKRAIEFNLRNRPGLVSKIEKVKVQAVTLDSIINNNSHAKIDLLVLDVEGHEYRILKQLANIQNLPRYIFFEKGTMSPGELKELHLFLTGLKYRIHTCGPDDLAVRCN